MSKGWNYSSGDWLIQCDVCSKKIKASEAKHRWDGFIVCSDDYENRHPQDFIRAKVDKISVPFSRPRSTDVFIELECNLATRSAYVGLATADCAEADQTWGMTYSELLGQVYCSEQARTAIPSLAIAGCATASYNIDAYI